MRVANYLLNDEVNTSSPKGHLNSKQYMRGYGRRLFEWWQVCKEGGIEVWGESWKNAVQKVLTKHGFCACRIWPKWATQQSARGTQQVRRRGASSPCWLSITPPEVEETLSPRMLPWYVWIFSVSSVEPASRGALGERGSGRPSQPSMIFSNIQL